MIDEGRIRVLVEEALDSDRTPEEVCSGFPELLADVRLRWDRVRDVQAQIDQLFPSAGSRAPPRPDEAWPRIPGHDVRSVLGRGGVGVVYRARHTKLNRDVAVKMLLAGDSASAKELARFLLEAEAVASLRHPNIVQVHDVGELEGRPFFTMELVEGGSLAQKLAGTPQPASVACAWMVLLAEAVQVAHEGGIVHRDLKPSNVLVTPDGTLKIADFGLARRLEQGASITASGIVLGTPSYMAPEQVLGAARAIGPAVDVYALGAILYEMLTGRPPFRAESALATQMQVVAEEPVPPSRLNAKVARDLETICMQCLRKDPARRYASGAALAADLRRFQRDEPIAARRTGPLERAFKWVRRSPARAAAIAGGTLLVCAALSAVLWLGLRRAATERGVRADLREVAQHEQVSNLGEARAALERAKGRIGAGASSTLRELVAQSERELELVARLDAIRLDRAAVVEGRFDLRANRAQADREYEAAFQAAGLGEVGDDPGPVAARIAASNLQAILLPALDDWALCAADADDRQRQGWLLEVARRADPDPTGWRNRVRDPLTWEDRTALEELAAEALEAGSSLPCLALAERLEDAGGDGLPLLERLQRLHPGDFWANFALGEALREAHPAEAVRYYQAALSLRPGAAVVPNNLGHALALAGRTQEAIEQFRRALRLDPRFAHAHSNLGNGLSLAGRHAEALEAYRQAVALDPRAPIARANLARALIEVGRLEDALAEAQQALALDPELATCHINLGLILMRLGRLDEAIEHDRRAIELDDERIEAHLNLGVALTAKGDLDEALAECRRAQELDPDLADVHAALCSVLRLRGEVDEAIRHGEQAVRIDPSKASHHNDLGAALANGGRLEEACERLREALRLDPTKARLRSNLGNVLGLLGELDLAIEQFQEALRLQPDDAQANGALGLALLGSGRLREAQGFLEKGLALFPAGSEQHAECARQAQLCAELLALEERLPAVLAGADAPVDAAEALRFALLCRLQQRWTPGAHLYADAFLRSPALAEDPQAESRYLAARCAALAGSGRDQGAVGSSAEERAGLRELARAWLREELVLHARALGGGSALARAGARGSLERWRGDRELACVRDSEELGVLGEDEREEWVALWAEVDALLALGGER